LTAPRTGGRGAAAPPAGRTLAASILREVESGRRLDVTWEASGAPESLERGWIRHLVYGTIRLRGRIDHILARYCARTLDDLDPDVIAALRMGAYQILEMDGVPPYAAVSEAVEQVKGTRSRAASGLVNAVLRKVAQARLDESSFPDPENDLEGYLSTWGSHPGWLVRRWIAALGGSGARALVEANNGEPRVYLRPVGASLAAARNRLAAEGMCEAPSAEPGRRRENGSDGLAWVGLMPGTDPGAALSVVPGVIQDPAASLVVDYVSPPTGARIADMCAAPGGKALALSESAGAVVAADLSPRRLSRLVEGVRRLSAQHVIAEEGPPGPRGESGSRRSHPRVWPVAADARHPPLRSADVVLVDVPCSGTGTLRRHPDGRWRLRDEDIEMLAELQRTILEGAASVVPRGGLLVYATCALEHEENWGQVRAFLTRHPDFRIEPGAVPDRFLDAKGCLAVLPHESGFDGAFAARMRRVGD
jgi:16S rRNA (cytosine967-C5)-methyltransferase